MNSGKRRKAAIRIGLVAVTVAAVGVVSALVVHSKRMATLETLYVDTAQRSHAREYPRAPAPPDWELRPGAAADAYREAWTLCEVEPASHDTRVGLNVAVRALRWDAMDARERRAFDDWAIDPSELCAPLLPNGNPDDPVMVYVGPANCERLLHCRPAFDRILEGSQRRDATSPLHLWSEWRIDESGDELRFPDRFTQIGKLQILHAYLLWMAGDRDASLDHTFAVLRLNMDVTRGAAFDGLVSYTITMNQGSMVQFVLSRPDLTAEEARRVYGELDHLLEDPADQGEIFQDTFLADMGSQLEKRDLEFPPNVEPWTPPEAMGWRDRATHWRLQGEFLEIWPRLSALQAESTPDRLVGYQREIPTTERDPLRSSASFVRSLRAFDLRTTLVHAHLALLRLVAADAALLIETGQPAESIEDLKRFDPELALVDPFSAQPFVLEMREDGRYLRSVALEDEETSGLVFLPNHNPPRALEIRLRDSLM